MSAALNWDEDGKAWPNREASRFVEAGGLRWHVQVMGAGPTALLLHGTGAASHSFADLAPFLSRRFTVVVPDLPGHGFTETPAYERLSLPAMAEGLGDLMTVLGLSGPDSGPILAAGHSAGAAILARMCLDQLIRPRLLVSLNGAILPLHGTQGKLFAPLAKAFVSSGFMPTLFAWRARKTNFVAQLMRSTGSTIDEDKFAHYATLAGNANHVEAAIGMMANWDLKALEPDLSRLEPKLLLITGANDRMIPPSHSLRLRRILPEPRLEILPDLGHLAHEENPDEIGALILDAFDSIG
ncbi:MAG: alpha/beta fold hydrolase BchO [Pseudomonadota bacterium]